MRESLITRRTFALLIVLLVALLVGGAVVAQSQTAAPAAELQATSTVCSTNFCVDRSVLAGSIAPVESDSFRLHATLGQTMTGLFSGDTYRLDAGFWTAERGSHTYLPAVVSE